MAELHVNDIISSDSEVKGLELFNKRSSVGLLSDTDEFSTEEMHRFLMYSRNILDSPITGSENFLGSLLSPQFENIFLEESIHDLLVEYYIDTYVDSTFRKLFDGDTSNSVIVVNKANQYGRCRIGAKIFGSVISSRHLKSSFILLNLLIEMKKVSIFTPARFNTFLNILFIYLRI